MYIVSFSFYRSFVSSFLIYQVLTLFHVSSRTATLLPDLLSSFLLSPPPSFKPAPWQASYPSHWRVFRSVCMPVHGRPCGTIFSGWFSSNCLSYLLLTSCTLSLLAVKRKKIRRVIHLLLVLFVSFLTFSFESSMAILIENQEGWVIFYWRNGNVVQAQNLA